MKNDSFCPLPWIGYAIKNNGMMRICCHANQGPTKGILLKNDGRPYTYKDDINEARNCNMIKEMRVDMLNNRWHPECVRCHREFRSGFTNRNSYESDRWNEFISLETAKQLTNPDGSIPINDIPLRTFDLRFGNLCNLRCRMCFATDSSGCYNDFYELYGCNFYHDAGQKLYVVEDQGKPFVKNSPYFWYEEDIFWEHMQPLMKDARYFYIAGGEPMLIKEHFNFLTSCWDYAKNIKIEYNTNLTVFPKHAIDLWKEFKEVTFGVSLDGLGKVNDYIRYHSKFDNVVSNIRKLNDSPGNLNMWVTYTTMVYNILNFPEFIKWKIKQQINIMEGEFHVPIVTSHPLHRPEQYNLKILPVSSKEYVKNYLEKSIPDIHKMIDEFYDDHNDVRKSKISRVINGYIKFMYQDDFSKYIPKFWEFTNKLDKLHGQSLTDFIPEVIPLVNGEM
jgi:sulfatase maturation enzyme AslB (radical SAM superfamily)